jgi:cyanophycinase
VPGIYGQSDTIVGPEKGTCLILGGGQIDKHIYQIFLDSAGGHEASIIVIPTAAATHPEKMDSGFVKLKNRFLENGIPHITVLHTADTTVANSSDFIAPLKKATGVWFTGGRQWRLMDAYANTKALMAFRSILDRGGIIAGTSAGATIQGSYLARGDTKTNTIMMGDHTEGFNFIRNVAIDQHVLARNRQFDLFDILDAHPDLLGIGLDEGTGLLINGNVAEVVGRSYVLIYDGYRWSAAENAFIKWEPGKNGFYFLKSGDKYNLHQRKKLP